MDKTPRYAEFFAGGGMVRAALGDRWACVLANDIDPMKCDTYRRNWGEAGVHECDIRLLADTFLRQPIDLYWGSSPCQDFSLAGKGLGLAGERSGVFEPWIGKVRQAVLSGFAPKIIAFENVTGLMTRCSGRDLSEVIRRISELGYRVGALEIDARHFLPQSRPRLFVIAVRKDLSGALPTRARGPFHTDRLKKYLDGAPQDIRANWVWWGHSEPAVEIPKLGSMIEGRISEEPARWQDVTALLSIMSPASRLRLERARESGTRKIGTLYKRGRPDENGVVRQRAEVRFDGIAGCLRTPSGGSSRQTILIVEGKKLSARLLSRREALRLMGLGEGYIMPERYNDAYKVAGDGVAVPVVRYLDEQIFRPVLTNAMSRCAA